MMKDYANKKVNGKIKVDALVAKLANKRSGKITMTYQRSRAYPSRSLHTAAKKWLFRLQFLMYF